MSHRAVWAGSFPLRVQCAPKFVQTISGVRICCVFEFEFCRRGSYFLSFFEFAVLSEFIHTQCNFTFTHVLWHLYTHVLMSRQMQTHSRKKREREIERETTPPRHATARPIPTHITDRHTQTTHTADTSHFHSNCGCVLDDTRKFTDGVKFLTCQLSMVGSGPTTAVPGNREFLSRFWSGSQGNV